MFCNFGTNDADYNVYKTERVGSKLKIIWQCPIYRDWYAMINRVYGSNSLPSYNDNSICDEWGSFMKFREWVLSQPNKDWQNCSLDKDILFKGNTVYSPEKCCYVDQLVNSFITDRGAVRGQFMLGVTWHKHRKCFVAQCANPFGVTPYEKRGYIGGFATEQEAHLAWKAKKREYAYILAEMQDDKRIADALRGYYI